MTLIEHSASNTNDVIAMYHCIIVMISNRHLSYIHLHNELYISLTIFSNWIIHNGNKYVAERAQCTANRKNTSKLRKQLHQFDNTCATNTHNTTKQRNVLQIKFFIWLCCELLQHLLSNWWRCFLDLLVLFLFTCVFWSCRALSSLGHRK